MTVESSSRKQNFAGGQSALTFSFKTLVAHPEFIKVAVTSGSTQTILTYNSGYTVSLNSDGVGGIVTVSPSYSTAYTYTVYRDTDDLQESDYNDFNQFPAGTLEDDLDRRTLISQERSDDVDRVPTLPISYTGSAISLPNPLDGYSLMWSGGTLVNTNLTGSTGAIGATGPSGATGSVSSVSSSTADIIVSSGSTTPIITLNLETAWADYSATSTIVGWTSFTQKIVLVKKIGKVVFVCFYLAGTSNSTACTLTLADVSYNTALAGSVFGSPLTTASDSGSALTVASKAQISTSSNTITIYKDMNNGSWSATGVKIVQGQLWYPIQ